MELHHEMLVDGTTGGRDPRQMSTQELEACGLERESRTDAIRRKCLDCCCYSPSEVRRCAIVDCALWPFRMGTDPWREARVLTDEQRRAMAERLAKGREAKRMDAGWSSLR